jgi:uncharacterized membrane protein
MTKKATAKPAATTKLEIPPTTTPKTAPTRPKYYRALDIFFYCLYVFTLFVVIGLALRVFKYNENLDDDWAKFYINVMSFIGVCMFLLTVVLIYLGWFTKYNVMYTILHPEKTKKEKFGFSKQVSFQM